MIIVYDDLYGKTYRNITDVLFERDTLFGELIYRIKFRFDGDKEGVLLLDSSPTRMYCYIQIDNERYDYYKINKNAQRFMSILNNELTKTALEALE